MIEKKIYKQFFDEEPRTLRPKDNLYYLEIEFDFTINRGKLTIQDCGGMMDMLACSPKQEKWAEEIMKPLIYKRIWVTVWEFYGDDTYNKILQEIEAKTKR